MEIIFKMIFQYKYYFEFLLFFLPYAVFVILSKIGNNFYFLNEPDLKLNYLNIFLIIIMRTVNLFFKSKDIGMKYL